VRLDEMDEMDYEFHWLRYSLDGGGEFLLWKGENGKTEGKTCRFQ
jgi:hypothetical protein